MLLASSELAELVGVCDRVVVLRDGRSVAELDTRQAGEADLLAASMGVAEPGTESSIAADMVELAETPAGDGTHERPADHRHDDRAG